MKYIIKKILILLLILVILGCTVESGDTGESLQNIENPSIDIIDKPNSAYPGPGEQIENLKESSSQIRKSAPVFKINKPVKSNSLLVTGTGPSDVPILLVDVSEVGKELSKTVISEDGKFEFRLNTPLIANHTIGIMLGDLTGTNLNPEDYIRSDSYYDRPLIGILFDIVIVEK
jgi:hypothetical protein